MDDLGRGEVERERQRAGIAWALADLDGLLARGVIGTDAHAALRRDYEARLAALLRPAVVEVAAASAEPAVDRPPPAPPARARRAAVPGDAAISIGMARAHVEAVPMVAGGQSGAHIVSDEPATDVVVTEGRAGRPEGVADFWINLVLFLGAFFVVIASLIFVASQWSALGAGAKAAIMGGFTLGFVAAGLVCLRLPRVRPAGQTFLGIGAILLPLDIAGGYTLLFRERGLSGAETWAWGSLVCLLFYGALALRGIGWPYAVATIAAAISAWAGTLAALETPRAWLAAAFLPLPLALLGAGRISERAAGGRGVFGGLPTWAAHLLIPVGCLLLPFPPTDRADAPGAVAALGLVALFYALAAISQPAPTLRGLHAAGGWAALALLAMALGWWADLPARGYAAVALGSAALALAGSAALWLAGAGWRTAAWVSLAAGWAHLGALLIPWGFFVRDPAWYWALVFGGATACVALTLWALRWPPLVYPLALGGALTLFHALAVAPHPDPYGYVWAYTLAALVVFALLQPLRLSGVSRAWDRHLVAVGQAIAIVVALAALAVGDPFQTAAVPVIALLASGLVVAVERRAELLILPNLWGLAATAAIVRLAGAGPRWAPACYAGVGLLLAIGLQGWRNAPAARRDVWYLAHRLSAGGWAVIGPILALGNLAPAIGDFLATGDLRLLVLDYAYGPSGLAVALCGAALAADAVMTLRRPTGYSASAMIALATLMGIARITPDNPQAYAIPLGVYLLTLSVYVAYERDLGPMRMPAANGLLAGAIVVLLGTTFLQSLVRPWLYLILGLIEGLALLGATAFLRRRYGVALSLIFLTLLAFRAVFDVARALPNWATLGLLGLALLGVGVLFLLRRDRLETWGSATLRRWSELT